MLLVLVEGDDGTFPGLRVVEQVVEGILEELVVQKFRGADPGEAAAKGSSGKNSGFEEVFHIVAQHFVAEAVELGRSNGFEGPGREDNKA